ncbi:Gamma-glutamylputrescine oxidoreductase [Frondihabitans sp. 762G35]|uniref:TIGR03364 family FAD-dependent oxidoreductase n=1 Tax=Frondihabitans sp. 762G35 TaxID=1446794 RepID=UPI000D202F3B|nr:TIGR03364 family FAD-dependent oxidoreductase [Frondihabitans sp. 762G35]ARC56494.1 Gamma-glutamylputrescine oxidoreductase [Frondihabitans sp. 762G35]
MAKSVDQTVDVAIVGAGIVGLGHALAAIDRGLSVVVIDRGSVQTGSSIRNFGHACISVQSGAAQVHADRTRELWLRLVEEAGLWHRADGGFVVARAEDELDVLREFRARRPDRVELLSAEETAASTGTGPGVAVGGARLLDDLQVDPREAVLRITDHLRSRGVEFQFGTAARTIRSGRLHTTRGRIAADQVIVAVNYDVDHLFPELGDRYQVERCALDMLRVEIPGLRAPLRGPVLTGWSMLRYSGFAGLPSLGRVRERLHSGHPAFAALDVNQMYTQWRDGSVIVGDTHHRGDAVDPFQRENAFDELLDATASLFGQESRRDLRVVERWQGVYASAPEEFLVDEPLDGVHVVSVTTGIGMTTGLGLADRVVSEIYEPVGA